MGKPAAKVAAFLFVCGYGAALAAGWLIAGYAGALAVGAGILIYEAGRM